MPRAAKKGDKVSVHYTGTLDDGSIFDSSREREPLTISLGSDELITGFEKAVIGMEEGEVKSITIQPNDAYGQHDTGLVKEIDRKLLPPDLHPEVGMRLQLGEEDDITFVVITDVTDASITLDANHPLAGYALNFEIELMKIFA